MCGYRKYQYPHHRGNWKFQKGWGGGGGVIHSLAQEIPEKWRGLVSPQTSLVAGMHDEPVRKSA